MNDKQIKSFLKDQTKGRKAVADNLYIRVQTIGKAYWEVRYSINNKRKFMRIEGGSYPAMSLATAKHKSSSLIQKVREGVDPLAEKARADSVKIRTVDDWYKYLVRNLKHPEITKRYYEKEIRPLIGDLTISHVNARDIKGIIDKVTKSNRPSIANKTLLCCKKLFNHACKLDLANNNPATAFKPADAGGVQKSRAIVLSFSELKTVFEIFRQNQDMFVRDNYLAISLLLSPGVRKTELTAAKWEEFDLEKGVWKLEEERTKQVLRM
ncbi:tyrosine-type recombinase/integrase [Psychrosphaera aestuarii]|uniref:tyrosine-type recombinase/integrase n=1 Tax=Psychrosphaera aestuarii TaxID=1266052 RepID=UPI001FCFFCCE|nr:DUF4102 domain-containing protein [Psychrosphaera aestuarii]